MTSTTEALSTATATERCGCASATASATAAQRQQRQGHPAAPGRHARQHGRPASRRPGSAGRSGGAGGGPRRTAAAPAGTTSSASRPSGLAKLIARRRPSSRSQSPSVLQAHVLGARAAQRRGQRLAALGLGGGEALAQPRPTSCRPRRGARSRGRRARGGPRRAAPPRAGRRPRPPGRCGGRAATRSARCHPSARKSETTTTRPGLRGPGAATRQRPSASPPSSPRPSGATPSAASRCTEASAPAPAARRQQPDDRRRRRPAAATRPAAAHGQAGEDDGDALGHVALQPRRRCRTPWRPTRRARSTSSAPARGRAGGRAATSVRALAAGSSWRTSSPGS